MPFKRVHHDKLTPEDVADYEAGGKTIKDIAERHRVAWKVVKRWLIARGVTLRPKNFNKPGSFGKGRTFNRWEKQRQPPGFNSPGAKCPGSGQSFGPG